MGRRHAWTCVLGCALACLGCAPAPEPRLSVRVLDAETGEPMACKLTLQPAHPGHMVPWGAYDMVGRWLADGVLGVEHTVFADPCDVALPVPVDDYRIVASAGIERGVASVEIPAARFEEPVELLLPRAVDTRGWACADLHVHSAPSLDSLVPLDQRLLNALAEGLDAIAPTDHNAIGAWTMALAESGMRGRLTLLIGNEITPDFWSQPMWGGHFGIYPVPEDDDPTALEQPWQSPGDLVAGIRRAYPDALIQANHPRINPYIGYLDAIGFDPATGPAAQAFAGLDAVEVWNSHEAELGMQGAVEDVLRDYVAALSTGRHLVATGNTDTHQLSRQALGYPRTCIRVADDRPEALTPGMLVDGLKAGAVMVTSGPWLEVALAGRGPGETVPEAEALELYVGVEGPEWVSVDRVQVWIDGRPQQTVGVDGLPFQESLPVTLRAGSHVMVLALGDDPLGDPAGQPAAPLRSLAFSNPIYVGP